MKKTLLAMGVSVCLGLSAQAWAAVLPAYTYVAVPTAPVTYGASNTYNLYLQEVLPSGSSYSIAGDAGLYSGAVALVEQGGGTGVTVTGATDNTASQPGGYSGGQNFATFTTSAADVIDSLGNVNSAVTPTNTSTDVGGTTTNQFLLGTVTLNVGASNVNATFNVESLYNAPATLQDGGTLGNTLTNNGTDLDDVTTPGITGADATINTVSFSTASPVPEPASMAVFGIGAAGLLVRRRKMAFPA